MDAALRQPGEAGHEVVLDAMHARTQTAQVVCLKAFRARRRRIEWDGVAPLYSRRFAVTVRNTRELSLLCEKHRLEPEALGLVVSQVEWSPGGVSASPVRIPSRLLCVYFSA
jgi:hypothetical protein